MHHPFRFATLIAVALAFTACTDSAERAITEPGGLRLTAHTGGQEAVYDEIVLKLNSLYTCETSKGNKKTSDKNSDLTNLKAFADNGWWTKAEKPGSQNVAYVANKLISDMYDNIAKGIVPATCEPHYADATELAAEAEFLIRVFASQGEFQGAPGEGGSFNCPPEGCDVKKTGPNGFGATVDDGTFGNNAVTIIFRPYTPRVQNSVGNNWNVDVYGFTGEAHKPWTRWICWDGFVGDTDLSPPPDYIVMTRRTEDGTAEELDTKFDDLRCEEQIAMRNPILRGAYKLFAGLPFLPSVAIAYAPPRGFGGTSTASSPHWLGFSIADLREKTDEYYGTNTQNKNAALVKLDAAEACETDACWNEALEQFISVVQAQTQPPSTKVLTAAQGGELMEIASYLMRDLN